MNTIKCICNALALVATLAIAMPAMADEPCVCPATGEEPWTDPLPPDLCFVGCGGGVVSPGIDTSRP
jgi:hypothetical protein